MAVNYSFYDGRVITGLILLLANVLKIKLKALNIILLVIAIFVSTATVMKIIGLIEKKKKTESKIQYVCLAIISYCCIYNFMTIDSMQFTESCIIMLSVLLYILSAENIIMKQNWVKGLLYCMIGVFSYQGSINMFVITVILMSILKHEKINKQLIKDLAISAGIAIISILVNFIYIKIFANYFNSVQSARVSLNIFENLIPNLKNIGFLLINTLDLFPFGVYIAFIISTLIITYIYSVKKGNLKIFFITLALWIMSIVSSLLLLAIYKEGVVTGNGRVFGSIGASISVLWIYLYIKTALFCTKDKLKYISCALLIAYFLINAYNILHITSFYKKANLIDEEFCKAIEKEIIEYEKNTDERIEYIAIKHLENKRDDGEKVDRRTFSKSAKEIAMPITRLLKVYTNMDRTIESKYWDEEDEKRYFNNEEPEMRCIGNTMYISI